MCTAESDVPMSRDVVLVDGDDDDEEVEEEGNQDTLGVSPYSAGPTTINLKNSRNIYIGPSLNYNASVTFNQILNVHNNQEAVELPIKAPPDTNGFTPGQSDVEVRTRWLSSHLHLLTCVVVAVVIVVIIAAVTLHFTTSPATPVRSPARSSSEEPIPDTTPDPTLVLNDAQRIYPRWSWSTYSPRFTRVLPHPTPYVVIAHSAEPGCNDTSSCGEILRNYQAAHVGKYDAPDIGYNFMIDNAGNVYEGRGWDATNFFTSFVTRRNIGVCFLGNYVYTDLTQEQEEALKDLLALGVKLGKLAPDYKLIAHCQTFQTLSPGKNILRVIDTWPHRCLSDCEIPFTSTDVVLF